MKKMISMFCVVGFSLAFASDDLLKREIKLLADDVYREIDHTNASTNDLMVMKDNLNQILNVLRNNGGSSNTYNDCMKYVLDQGYPPPIAQSVCQNLRPFEFECVKNLGNTGYPPQQAKTYCESIDSKSEYECMNYIIDKGYGPDMGRNTCLNVSQNQFDCIKNIMDRGYDPISARNTCNNSH